MIQSELMTVMPVFFFFQAEDGIRDVAVTGVQTCALPILAQAVAASVLQSSAVNGQASTGLENAVSVELGGLARRRSGFWTDVKYHWRPAFLRKSILGRGFEDPQLIPIVRYERVWLRGNLESLDFAGGAVTNLKVSNREQGRLSFGVNYRPAH